MPRRRSPARVFLEHVKAIEVQGREWGWWPDVNRGMAKMEREGFWWRYTAPGRTMGTTRQRYALWALGEGTYCTRGRPIYSLDRLQELYEAAETEKLIHRAGYYSFHLVWKNWDPETPNNICWGLRKGPTLFEIRYKNRPVACEPNKTRLLQTWKNKPWMSDE